jgi:hypothetical protein
MSLWEMMTGGTNNFTALVHANEEDAWSGTFKPNGLPKHWETRPHIQPFVDKKRKNPKPQADIGHLVPGAMVLNEKSYNVLKDFLQQYGQLLPVDCKGEVKYYYNVTHLISVIDVANSEKLEGGTAIVRARFLDAAIPKDAQIFKDPITANARIYLSTAAKEILEKNITENGLTGILFFRAGENWC